MGTRGDSNEYSQHMFLWRNKQNYPLIIIGIILSRQRTTKVLIRLRRCADWSAPLLFSYGISRFSHDRAHYTTITVSLQKRRVLQEPFRIPACWLAGRSSWMQRQIATSTLTTILVPRSGNLQVSQVRRYIVWAGNRLCVNTVKVLKNWDTRKNCCNYPKIEPFEPRQANLCLRAFRHDKFQLRMPSHSEGPGIWLSVWRFLLTHCLYERAAKILARLRGCAGSPESSLLA